MLPPPQYNPSLFMALLTLKFVTDLRKSHAVVVEFHGELDQSTIPGAERKLAEFLDTATCTVCIFDFSNLSYINSEGLGLLMSTHAKLAKRKLDLAVAAPKPNVADIFELIGLAKIIPVFPTLPLAVEKYN